MEAVSIVLILTAQGAFWQGRIFKRQTQVLLIKLADDRRLRERGQDMLSDKIQKPNPQKRKLKGIILRSGTWIQKEHHQQRIKDIWWSSMEKF